MGSHDDYRKWDAKVKTLLSPLRLLEQNTTAPSHAPTHFQGLRYWNFHGYLLPTCLLLVDATAGKRQLESTSVAVETLGLGKVAAGKRRRLGGPPGAAGHGAANSAEGRGSKPPPPAFVPSGAPWSMPWSQLVPASDLAEWMSEGIRRGIAKYS